MAHGAPAMRVCVVTEAADFLIDYVADANDATTDAEIVPCGPLADASVRVVTSGQAADMFLWTGDTPGSGWNSGNWNDGEWNE